MSDDTDDTYNPPLHINGNIVKMDVETKRYKYSDGVDAWDNERECPNCNLMPTKEGHDACLGTLPGVEFACCGHGITQGYVKFNNGKIIRFDNMTT